MICPDCKSEMKFLGGMYRCCFNSYPTPAVVPPDAGPLTDDEIINRASALGMVMGPKGYSPSRPSEVFGEPEEVTDILMNPLFPEVESLRKRVAELEAALDAGAQAQGEAAVLWQKILDKVEWLYTPQWESGEPECRFCENERRQGHKPSCTLKLFRDVFDGLNAKPEAPVPVEGAREAVANLLNEFLAATEIHKESIKRTHRLHFIYADRILALLTQQPPKETK